MRTLRQKTQMRFGSLGLSARISLGFGLLIALSLGVAATAIVSLSHVAGSVKIMNDFSTNVVKGHEAARLLEVIRRTAVRYRIDADPAALDTMKNAGAELSALMADAAKVSMSGDRRKHYEAVNEMLLAFNPEREAFLQSLQQDFAGRTKLFL